MPKRIGRKGIIAIVLALITLVGVASLAFFTDRVDHSMQFTTSSFSAEGYTLTRVAPEGPFCAGEDVTATLKESNTGTEDVNSVISMKATWVSPDTGLSIFGNASAADNAKLSIGGTDITYNISTDKKSITFDLPKHALAVGTRDAERELTLTIPASFTSTGRIEFTFEKVVVGMDGSNFTKEFDRTALNASSTLDYKARVGWAASSIADQNGKALMGYLTDKNSSGKYGIEFEFAFDYTASPMKDFASRTGAKWSYYKDKVDRLTFIEGMTTIGDYAFPDFSGVKSVSFPASVEKIGVSAFDASGLTGTVTIPATVKEIKSLAFGNLPNVNTFTFGHTTNSLTLPDNTSASKRNTGAFYVPTHVDTTVNTTVEAIMYGYKWHDGYDNRRAVPTLNAQDTWFRTGSTSKLDEDTLETITFADYHMPVTGETSWDASDPSVPGTVTAFLSADKKNLIIAGNGYGLIFANENSSGAFSNLTALKTVSNTDLLDTRNATTMADMFNFDKALANISVTTWNVSKVTDMSNMFYCCDSLPSIDLRPNTCTAKDGSGAYTAWNTASLKKTSGMFMDYGGQNHSLTAVDTTGWDTSKLEDASYMFMECRGLTEVKGIENWDVSSLKDAHNMFQDCQSLETINVANWNTASLENASVMFSSCHSLRSIDITKWDMSKVTKSNAMFSYCKSFTELTLPKSLVVIGSYFAGSCPKLTTITFNHPAGTDIQFSSEAFYIANNDKEENETGYIEYTPVSPLGTKVVTSNAQVLDYDWTSDHRGYVVEIKTVEGGTLTGAPVTTYNGRKAIVAINGKTITFTDTADEIYSYNGATVQYSQGGTTKTTELDKNTKTFVVPVVDDNATGADIVVTPKWAKPVLAAGDTWYKGTTAKSAVTEIQFVDAYTATGSETESWDASANLDNGVMAYLNGTKLTIAGNGYRKILANANSANAFSGFTSLTAFTDLNKLDTSAVTNMQSVFKGCSALTSLDLSSFNTGAVTTMTGAFTSCNKLQTVTLGKDFKFVGTDGYLPAQSSTNIAGADGKWYVSGFSKGYTPAELGAVTRVRTVTYSAIPGTDTGAAGSSGGEVPEGAVRYPLQSGSLTYTGDEQSPVWNGYDTSKLIMGGETAGTNAKTYTATFTPKDGYSWIDGTADTLSVTWKIEKAAGSLSLNKTSETLFNASAWNITVTRAGDGAISATSSNTNVATVSVSGTTVTVTKKAPGTATITVKVAEGTNHKAPADKTATVTCIGSLSVPSQKGTLTYTGSAQTPTWNNYSTTSLTIGGTQSGTNAGSYTATFTPKTYYRWSDGTSTAKNVTWSIGKAAGSLSIGKSSATIDYNATTTTFTVTRAGDGAISVTSSAPGVATASVSGNTVTVTKVAAGTATITVKVAEGSNHKAPADKTATVTCIGSLSVPSQKGTLTYTGSAQTPTWNNYSTTSLTIGGTQSGTNAGSYTATFTPKTYYRWSDGTSTAKNVTWSIGKAAGSLSIGKSSATIDYNATTTTFTVTRAGDGAISVTSSAPGVATASVSGNTVTVTKVAAGTATITVKVAEGSNHKAPADKTCAITCVGSLTVPSQKGTLTYTGSAQSPTWNNYSTTSLTIGGTTSGTNAKSYTATFTPKTNYKWSDGTSTAKSVTWSIGKAAGSVTLGKTSATIDYNATTTTFTASRSGDGTLSVKSSNTSVATVAISNGTVTVTKKAAGTATITVTAAEGTNHKAASKTCSVTCVGSLTVPSQKGTLTYTGSAQTPTWNNYSTTSLTIGGTQSGTNAKSYTATFTPKTNYKWSDGTSTAKSVTWSIGKAAGSVTLSKTSATIDYNATTTTFTASRTGDGTLSVKSSNTSVATVAISNGTVTVTKKAAGTATITVTAAEGTNHKAASKTCSVTCVGSLTVPSQKGTLTYTGSAQTPTWNNYSTTSLTIGGTQSGTNAGSYTATFTPKTNYKWSDGTTDAKSMTWKIGKAAGSLTLSKSSATLDYSTASTTFTVTRAGNGAISVTSDKTSVATASVSGNTVTVTKVGQGSATITVSVAAGTNHTAPANKTFTVTCKTVPQLAAKNTWYKGTTAKSAITEILFVDTYTATGSETERWDASATQDGSVMAYLNGTKLTIAGNGYGKIMANADSTSAFNAFSSLTKFTGLDKLDTSNVTVMQTMFNSLSAIQTLDLSSFNTAKVTNFYGIFGGNKKLTTLNLTGWNTAAAKDMGQMFYTCNALTTINGLSGFNTANATQMYGMFHGCKALTSLDLSNFNTAKVKSLEMMFYQCYGLKTVNLTSFDTSSATSMHAMFQYCSGLTSLDLSSFNTGAVTNMADAFTSCNKLQTVTLGKNFKFVGTDGYLPAQSSSNIAGADGKWYVSGYTKCYTPAELAAVTRTKAVTYSAIPGTDSGTGEGSGSETDIRYPKQGGTLTYTGSAQSPSWSGYSSTKLTIGGTTSGTNAGTYTATFTPKAGYCWIDGTMDTISVTWKIGKATVSAPTQSGSLTYNGKAQTPSWSGYDSAKLTLGGTTSGTNAKSYTATFTPKANYQWSDGTSTAKSVTWKIGKAAGSVTLGKTSATIDYNATTTTFTASRTGDGTLSVKSNNTNVATVAISNGTVTVTKKAAGTATITVTAAEGTNHKAASKTCSITCVGSLTVPAQSGTLTYTGSAQSPSWNSNYATAKMTLGGTTSGTNAGSYTATFTPKTNYKWSDGTTAAKSVTWSIGKAAGSVTLSKSSATIDYNATTTTFTASRTGNGTLSVKSSNTGVATVAISNGTVTVTKKGAGTATITVTAAEGTNHKAASKTCSVTCVGSLTVPSQKGTLTYTGSAQTPTWNNYSTTSLTIGGTQSGTNAGSYTATFTPKTNYKWSDGTSTAKSVTWKIGKAAGSVTLSKTSATIDYNATTTTFTASRTGDGTLSVKSSNTNVATVAISNGTVTVTKKAAGTATITVTAAEGTNHKAASKTCSVTCVGSLTVPAQSGTLTYTGSAQSPSWNSNYATAKMTLGGTTSGTNAGSYTATFTPKTNYKWSDGTSTAKSVSWKIGKAAGSVTLSKSSATIDYNATTTTFTASRTGDGTLSVKSSNTSVATVAISNGTVTVTKKGAGTATITVTAAEGTNHKAASKTCTVTCKTGTPVSSLAVGSSVYMNVGGVRKEFLVVHQGKPSSLYDDSCNGTWLLMKDVYESRQWNSFTWGTTSRLESSTIHSYLNSTFLNLFDGNVKNGIKQVKIPYATYGGRDSDGDDIFSNLNGANGLSCKIFLLSLVETSRWTDQQLGWNGLPRDGDVLDYFKDVEFGKTDNNYKRIAYQNGSAVIWWLRTPYLDQSWSSMEDYAGYIDVDGHSTGNVVTQTHGVRPALILYSNTLVDANMNVIASSTSSLMSIRSNGSEISGYTVSE